MKYKYKYTMLLSPIVESNLLSSFENTEVRLVMKVPIEIKCDRDESAQLDDLRSKIGLTTPDALYEFVGFEDLVKVIQN